MTTYERIIDIDEIGVVDGLNLLLSHYRFWISGEEGCILLDVDGKLIATVNLDGIKPTNLAIKCSWVWQAPFYYSFKGDFTSPISYKKENYDTL